MDDKRLLSWVRERASANARVDFYGGRPTVLVLVVYKSPSALEIALFRKLLYKYVHNGIYVYMHQTQCILYARAQNKLS